MNKLAFGTSARDHISRQLNAYVDAMFGGNKSAAAANLGIQRQRLFSYTSGKSFPRPDMIELIGEKWGIDLVGISKRGGAGTKEQTATPIQAGLFDEPVTLRNDQMTVVIERKGPSIAVRIEIAAQAKVPYGNLRKFKVYAATRPDFSHPARSLR